MFRRIPWFVLAFALFQEPLFGQKTVCEVFEDLGSSNHRQILVTGELFLSEKGDALTNADCDNEFVLDRYVWPTVISLRPAPALSESRQQRVEEARSQIEAIRKRGKVASATVVFSGRMSVVSEGDTRPAAFGPNGRFPAELVYDDVVKIFVEELPAAAELPTISICDLFKNLSSWNGKRIAIRAEEASGGHGSLVKR